LKKIQQYNFSNPQANEIISSYNKLVDEYNDSFDFSHRSKLKKQADLLLVSLKNLNKTSKTTPKG
jgi:hypothetical protein